MPMWYHKSIAESQDREVEEGQWRKDNGEAKVFVQEDTSVAAAVEL